jgi:hypothetical protein
MVQGYVNEQCLICIARADRVQILVHSVEKEYFLLNLPWLIGSLGTMAEDAIIFIQFRIFGSGEQTTAIE